MKWISKLILSSFFIFFTANSFAQKDSDVVATAGTKKITVGELNKKYKEAQAQAMFTPVPNKKVFLEDLIRYEIGVQEAHKRNLEKDPAVQELINQSMYKGLLEKELGEKVQNITVSDAEMKSWYTNNPQIRLSIILTEVKPGATAAQREEARKRANEILAEVKSSKRPFEELVKLYSDDISTKGTGGDVGWQSRLTLNPAYYDTAVKLRLNEITSSLVELPFGFQIIKLTGKRTFEEAPKREIRMSVFDEKRKVLFDQYFDKLKKNYPINVNTKLLD